MPAANSVAVPINTKALPFPERIKGVYVSFMNLQWACVVHERNMLYHQTVHIPQLRNRALHAFVHHLRGAIGFLLDTRVLRS